MPAAGEFGLQYSGAAVSAGGAAGETPAASGRDEPAGAKPLPGAAGAGPAAQGGASEPAAAVRFPPGSKVLFCAGGQGGCVKGTVAKVVSSGGKQPDLPAAYIFLYLVWKSERQPWQVVSPAQSMVVGCCPGLQLVHSSAAAAAACVVCNVDVCSQQGFAGMCGILTWQIDLRCA